MHKADAIAWPVRMLAALLPEEGVVEAILGVLSKLDTEYQRDSLKKLDLLKELEQRRDPRIAAAVVRFIADVNESARYHAVAAYAAQAESAADFKPVFDRVFEDESARVRARALDACIARGQVIPADVAHLARAKAPPAYSILADGTIKKG